MTRPRAGPSERSSGMRNTLKIAGGIGIAVLGTLEPMLGAVSWLW